MNFCFLDGAGFMLSRKVCKKICDEISTLLACFQRINLAMVCFLQCKKMYVVPHATPFNIECTPLWLNVFLQYKMYVLVINMREDKCCMRPQEIEMTSFQKFYNPLVTINRCYDSNLIHTFFYDFSFHSKWSRYI